MCWGFGNPWALKPFNSYIPKDIHCYILTLVRNVHLGTYIAVFLGYLGIIQLCDILFDNTDTYILFPGTISIVIMPCQHCKRNSDNNHNRCVGCAPCWGKDKLYHPERCPVCIAAFKQASESENSSWRVSITFMNPFYCLIYAGNNELYKNSDKKTQAHSNLS